MKNTILLLVFVSIQHTISAQKHDAVWLTGYDEFPGIPGNGHALIRFQGSGVTVEPTQLPFNFESTVAAMSDAAGNLLFYTNGCQVANRNNVVMPNGTGLSPGALGNQVCGWKGYSVPQGALVLPFPGDSSRYYLFHIGGSYDPVRKIRLGPLYYSVVDMTLDGGLGDLASKNNVLIVGDLASYTAVRHGNGRDWWIIVPEFEDKLWHRFLLGPAGFIGLGPQTIPIFYHGCEHYGATAVAPDGSRVANWGDCKVVVLDFDRCSGQLSNLMELDAPAHWVQGGGVAFSPSGRYLYATSQTVLFRADLESANPKLDTMRFSFDPYLQSPYDVPGNTFHGLVNAPDGNLYCTVPSRATFMHVLKYADGATIDDIEFIAQGLSLAVKSVRTLPNLPNYRLYDLPDSPCDTLQIDAPVATKTPAKGLSPLVVMPNPNDGIFSVTLPEGDFQNLIIFNSAGQRVGNWPVKTDSAMLQIDMGKMPSGLYWAVLYDAYGMVAGRVKMLKY